MMGVQLVDRATSAAKLERRLVQTERRFGAILDSTYQFIGIIDPTGQVLVANQTSLRFVGATLQEVQGTRAWDTPWLRDLPDDQLALRRAVAEAAEGSFIRITLHYRKASGELRTFDVSLTPVGLDDRVEYLIAEGRDISEPLDTNRHLREAQDALAKSRMELASILHNTPDVIYRLDQEGRITFVSDAVRRYGYELDAMIGTSIVEYVHPEDVLLARDRLNERRTGDRSTRELQLRMFTKGGEERVVEYGSAALERESLFEIRAEDARARLEKQLFRAQKFETIGTLASGIAHDFNNILTIIGANASLLTEEALGEAKRLQSVDAVRCAVERGARIVGQLLTIARKNDFAPRVIELNSLITETLQLLRVTIPQSVEIRIELSASPAMIMGDPNLLN